MRSRTRVAAALMLSLALGISSSPVGATDAAQSARLRPAVLDRTLAGKLLKAKPTQSFETIVSVWDRSVLRQLDRMRIGHRKMRVLPMAFAKLTSLQIGRLLGIRGVRSIYAPRTFRPMLNEGPAMIGARHVADTMGIDGTGATVAVIDTGVDALHPDLTYGEKVIANYEVLSPGIFDPGSPLVVDMPNTDDDGHGTHVSGTIAGSGAASPEGRDLRGVAPGAKLIVYSANQGLTLLETHTTAAFDDILAKREETKVRAVSNSWGGGDGFDYAPEDPTAIAQETAFKLGVLPVFAAGNGGSPGDTTIDGVNTLSQQCISPYVVCVGAVTKHHQVVTFSSVGRPSGAQDRVIAERYRVGMYRPTITAPGVNITAPAALAATADADAPYGYMSISGTSMAAPHVTGVVALMAAANPKLTPRQMIEILERTADAQPGWDAHQEGAGMVNAKRAVEAALALKAGKPLSLPPPQYDYTPPARAAKSLATFSGSAIPASWVHKQGVESHTFNVPAGVERLDITLSWPNSHENLYGFLWAPGDTPNDENPLGAPFPTQETWGLLCDGPVPVVNPCMLTERKMLVTYPEPGTWTLRVFARTLASSYEVKVDSLTYTVPSVSASVAGGRLTGTASFPIVETSPRTIEMVPGIPARNPTEKPRAVYFHGSAPVGNLDVLSGTDPGWSSEAPTGGTGKASHGVFLANQDSAGAGQLVARFSGMLERPIEGEVELVFWGSAATALSAWSVALLVPGEGDEYVVAGTADVSPIHVPGSMTRVVARVRDVRLAAGTPLTVQIGNLLAPVFSVHYDAEATPSGMVLPEVSRLLPDRVDGLETAALLAEDLRNGSVKLLWPRVSGALAYRIYQGTHPDRLAPVRTVASGPPGKQTTTETIEGTLAVGNPGTQFGAGLVNSEFFLSCSTDLATNGTDGVVIPLKEGAGDGLQTMTVKGEGIAYDIDVYFYDEDCSQLDETLASEQVDESGAIPEGAAYAIVNLWSGVNTSFTATYTVGGDKTGAVIDRLRPGVPLYFRVAALGKGGAEGVASDLVTLRPTALERAIEVSVDGVNWVTTQTVNGTGRRASFSVPASLAASS
ncbi:MAG: S8 family serine peptidase, partial [Actinomycetota bacterium]